MMKPTPKGVFAAALTPLTADGALDLDGVLPYMDFLAKRGCHGTLLFGTTGEGPSFSARQRVELIKVACEITRTHPEFTLLMGTGTPSLDETIALSRAAFDHGMHGVVVLPPYFVRSAGEEGLFAWFGEVIRKAVPKDGYLLAYHIPQMTGMHMTLELFDRLKEAFPGQFVGLKNSWTEAAFARSLGERFRSDLTIMAGFDNLLQLNLSLGGSGCITASASVISPVLRKMWDQTQRGEDTSATHAELERIRGVMDKYPPAPALLKGLIAEWHGFPRWNVCPPLVAMKDDVIEKAAEELGGPF